MSNLSSEKYFLIGSFFTSVILVVIATPINLYQKQLDFAYLLRLCYLKHNIQKLKFQGNGDYFVSGNKT